MSDFDMFLHVINVCKLGFTIFTLIILFFQMNDFNVSFDVPWIVRMKITVFILTFSHVSSLWSSVSFPFDRNFTIMWAKTFMTCRSKVAIDADLFFHFWRNFHRDFKITTDEWRLCIYYNDSRSFTSKRHQQTKYTLAQIQSFSISKVPFATFNHHGIYI